MYRFRKARLSATYLVFGALSVKFAINGQTKKNKKKDKHQSTCHSRPLGMLRSTTGTTAIVILRLFGGARRRNTF
jgi:hypothetical protein